MLVKKSIKRYEKKKGRLAKTRGLQVASWTCLPWRVHVSAASRVVAMGLTALPRVTPPQCQPAPVTEALMHVRLATVLQVTITSTQVWFIWYHLLRRHKGKFSPSVLLEVALQSRQDFTPAEQTLVPIQHCFSSCGHNHYICQLPDWDLDLKHIIQKYGTELLEMNVLLPQPCHLLEVSSTLYLGELTLLLMW